MPVVAPLQDGGTYVRLWGKAHRGELSLGCLPYNCVSNRYVLQVTIPECGLQTLIFSRSIDMRCPLCGHEGSGPCRVWASVYRVPGCGKNHGCEPR